MSKIVHKVIVIFLMMRPFIFFTVSPSDSFEVNALEAELDDGSWLNIPCMRKFRSFFIATLLGAGFIVSCLAESYVFPGVGLHDLPNPLQEAYKHEKPNLGDIGRCVVSFDSNVAEDKMIFTCSIYVKMSAVAERKAMERCEAMRASKGIKNPCRVVHE